MNKKNLDKAKKLKNDEYYTRIEDIQNELKWYQKYFKNKIVFCNCDNPNWSNFYKYFKSNFKKLKIKKLITTHFSNTKKPYKLELELKNNKLEERITELKNNGDFRSDECIEILKTSDIVVTNPPFSLFREYVAQLINYNKHFLIIGNMNAISYKEIFPLIKKNKIWLGINSVKEFFTWNKNKQKIFKKYGNINWYTNIPYTKRKNEEIVLFRKYNKDDYIKYDNYDAIEVSKVKDIPKNYYEEMGVPISFLLKHNPNQFQITGFRKGIDGKDLTINNKPLYARILIKKNLTIKI